MICPYTSRFNVYRCPDDRSTYPLSGGQPRVRSMSMNSWTNPISSWNDTGRHYPPSSPNRLKEFRKQSDLNGIGFPMAWVFIDENPWGINDAFFVCGPNRQVWIDIPASYHNGACAISFADGHAEIMK